MKVSMNKCINDIKLNNNEPLFKTYVTKVLKVVIFVTGE